MSHLQERFRQVASSSENISGNRGANRQLGTQQPTRDNNLPENNSAYFIEPKESSIGIENSSQKGTRGKPLLPCQPSTGFNKSILSSVRRDLGGPSNNMMKFSQIPSFEVTASLRDNNRVFSPSTINIGETAKDREYNIRTLNAKRGLNQRDLLYQTYTRNYNEDYQTNNSYIQNQNQNPGNFSYQKKEYDMPGQYNIGNIQSSTVHHQHNPSDSLVGRETDDSRFSQIKYQMENNDGQIQGSYDEQMNPNFSQHDITDINYLKSQGIRALEMLSKNEVKRIVKKLTKVYDPNHGNEGALISTFQTIMPSDQNDLFKDRYQVLQKMNRLSSILLAKEKANEAISRHLAEKKTFDRNTLSRGTLDKDNKDRTIISKTPKQKFLYISLALISSKGPNCEDRIILRKMRFDKGGVVDLAQDSNKSKSKYKVQKITTKRAPIGSNFQRTNPKFREKAAKTVQSWWRYLRDKYKRVYDKIILIQTCWRGRWIRKYMYDIIYLSCLYQSFCQSIQRVLINHVGPTVFELLSEKKIPNNGLLYKIFENDLKFRSIKIKPYWEMWKDALKKYNTRNLKSKNLFNIKRNNENNFKTLQKAFGKYRLISRALKYMSKATAEEEQKRKYIGLAKMIQGKENLSKRIGLRTVKQHLNDYLDNKKKQNAYPLLTNLLLKYSKKMNNNRLAREFSKWKAACFAKKFLNKLKELKDSKEKFEKLKDLLCQGKESSETANQSTFIERIYKLYVYYILKKLFSRLRRKMSSNKIPLYKKLMNRIMQLSTKSSVDSYKLKKSSKLNTGPKVSSLAFKAKVSKPKTTFLDQTNESSVYFRLTPYLVTYLKKRYNEHNQWALSKLKQHSKNIKFCSLYKKHSKTQLKAPKKEMIEEFRSKCGYLNNLGNQQSKLYKLIRRYILTKIRKGLVGPSIFYRLLYLIKITIMFKALQEKRFGREVVRKWRFVSFVKKMAKRKLEKMYLNLHSNFIQMTNEVFGENEIDPSVMSQVEHFGENIGMFVNEPTHRRSGSDHLNSIAYSQQVMFDPELMAKEFPQPSINKKKDDKPK